MVKDHVSEGRRCLQSGFSLFAGDSRYLCEGMACQRMLHFALPLHLGVALVDWAEHVVR